MSKNVANNSHESDAGKLRRSSLALREKRCYQRVLNIWGKYFLELIKQIIMENIVNAEDLNREAELSTRSDSGQDSRRTAR